MMEAVRSRAWIAGLWLRNCAKRLGLLGPLEPALLKLAPRLMPAPKTELRVRLHSGSEMTVPAGYPSARSYAAGLYEPEVTRLLQRLIKPGMTVVDAGANIGYYTLLAAHIVGPSGHVYAFEPDPLNFAYLTRNLESTGCSNAKAIKSAIASTVGNTRFVPDLRGAEGFLTTSAENRSAIDVPTTTLDAYFQEAGWPVVHTIKLDIEGSEFDALKGMRGLSLRNPHLNLIMELNAAAISRSGQTIEDVIRLLRQLGFASGYVIEVNQHFSLADKLPSSRATHNLLLTKIGSHVGM